MKIEHCVFINEVLIKAFTNSNWYDTASPYQFCISELIFLKHKIESGQKLTIESLGEIYKIDNLSQ